MATYVIGDIQGCFDALMELLEKIHFDSTTDKLIFCGDLVNRGGQSLQVLRWIYAHQKSCNVTLGNHDLSLLAQYYIPQLRKPSNLEFREIFRAHDCSLLMNWLKNQKLLIHLKKQKVIIVHAGIYPLWSLKKAKNNARFLEKTLKGNHLIFFKNMYGSKPNHWQNDLKPLDKARFIVNSFTRMRFLFKNNGLNFKAKGSLESSPKLTAWFKIKPCKNTKTTIIFGHWSTLGLYQNNSVICLDTGKVWGGRLTALKLSKSGKTHKHLIQV